MNLKYLKRLKVGKLPSMRQIIALSFTLLVMFVTGCSSIQNSRYQKRNIVTAYHSGDFTEAIRLTKSKVKSRSGTGDELMWLFELGSLQFYSGKYKNSLETFRKAEVVINDYENRAKLSLRDGVAEGEAVATNLNALPYKGNYVDKLLLNTYKALNYFALGDAEGGNVELRRVRNRQKEIRKEFDQEIADAEKEAKKKGRSGKDIIDSTRGMGEENKKMAQHMVKDYGNFVNPFSTYMSAIGYLSENNVAEAVIDFKALYKMDPSNALVRRDLVTCAKSVGVSFPKELADIKPWSHSLHKKVVYIIFANGNIAAKKQFKFGILLPPPVAGYSSIYFPILEYFPAPIPRELSVVVSGKTYRTTPVADMDSIVTKEYKMTLPAILIKTFISIAAKETASYLLQQATKNSSSLTYYTTIVLAGLYKYAFNTADTRCWQFLPKSYSMLHCPYPKNGTLKLLTKTIKLDMQKNITIIYVNKPTAHVLTFNVISF